MQPQQAQLLPPFLSHFIKKLSLRVEASLPAMSGGDKGPFQQGPGPFPPQLLLHLPSCSPWDLNATLRSTTPSLALGANTGVSSKAFSWHGQQSCPHPKSQPCSPEQLALCRCGHAILLFSWPRTFQPFLPQSGTGVPSPSIPSSWTPADVSVCSQHMRLKTGNYSGSEPGSTTH